MNVREFNEKAEENIRRRELLNSQIRRLDTDVSAAIQLYQTSITMRREDPGVARERCIEIFKELLDVHFEMALNQKETDELSVAPVERSAGGMPPMGVNFIEQLLRSSNPDKGGEREDG